MAALKRILVADDDPDVQQLLAAALEASGRQIDGARDGLEALSRVEAVPYDLVLTDLHMPGLDGLALLERIRRSRPATKVVVMTGSGTPESVVRSIREQAFTYFSKPFAIRAVVEMVASALSGTSPEDDIEVLSARPNWLALRLRCRMETAGRILQFMHELGGDLPANQWENVAAAFREILLNAIEHGGGSDPKKWVRITYVRTARAVIYHVRDPGPGFSFGDLPHAAVSNPESSPFEHTEVRNRMGMRPGGFGILMTRQMIDELIYNEAGNEAMLVKYLES
jgi:CheY-like chemotaxis protein/anti-sigma regulatory factor (Ser/Thr protein kinase)